MLAVMDRVYGFRSKVSQAEREIGTVQRGGALVQLVQLRSNDELANTNDEHVIAAVDYLRNTPTSSEPRTSISSRARTTR